MKIIQASPPRSGSTLLVNMLAGFMCKDEAIHYVRECGQVAKILTKTHNLDIDGWIEKNIDGEIYFIVSERKELSKILDSKYYKYKNVIIFQYEELLETDKYSVENIVENAYIKIKKAIPNLNLDKNGAIERIVDMNNLYEKIKHKSYNYYDKFYHIHGSHRNRKD